MFNVRHLGRLSYSEAFELQRQLVAERKQDLIPDQLLLVEHPHVITIGRNGHPENLLASDDVLRRSGIDFHECDRGGDVTYHGPGQVVGYPIFDLSRWHKDVHMYVRALEQILIDTLADFAITATRIAGLTGVWVDGRKIGAIGVHISRWVTSHGFALNLTTDLSYFQYIVPCGLAKPVTSIHAEGARPSWAQVTSRLIAHFERVFDTEEILNDRRSNAADGREHRRRHLDQVAQEAR